jgi:DNA-binding NarL/FixJ family response regulator
LRLLVCDVDAVKALALERALGSRFELRVVGTLADAERELQRPDWRPDVIVASTELPDSGGGALLVRLGSLAGPIPILVSNGFSVETLRKQVEAVGGGSRIDPDALTVLRTFIHQQQLVQQTIAASRTQILAEIERIAAQAAEAAVSRAVERLMIRLGLEDTEGVRLAVRLARAWEAAKAKFVSALATGIASAFLLALGAGFVALLKSGSSK